MEKSPKACVLTLGIISINVIKMQYNVYLTVHYTDFSLSVAVWC